MYLKEENGLCFHSKAKICQFFTANNTSCKIKCNSMKTGGIRSSLPLRADDVLLTLKHKKMSEIKPLFGTNCSGVHLFSVVKCSFNCILVI